MDEELFAKAIAAAIELSDDEVVPYLEKAGLSPEEIDEALDIIEELGKAEGLADANLDPINIDSVDKLADANIDPINIDSVDKLADANTKKAAQKMANEDDTEVKVTEEDKDEDGDTDKVTVEKSDADDDSKLSAEEEAALNEFWGDNGDDKVNDKAKDKPHDADVVSDRSLKNIIGTLSSFKY